MYVGLSILSQNMYAKMSGQKYMTQICSMPKVGFGRIKPTCDTRIIHFDKLYARAALAWMKKKLSLRNEKLKANRASETEEQRKEGLRIRFEKDRARRRTKKLQVEKNRSSETEDHQN